MKKWYTLLFLTGWLLGSLQAQAPNDCPRLYMGSAQAEASDTVCLDVRADQLASFIGLENQIVWDSTQLALVDIINLNLPELTTRNFTKISIANERALLILSWFTPSLQSVSIPDSSVLYTLCFETLPEFSGQTNIRFRPSPDLEIIYEASQQIASTLPILFDGAITQNTSAPDLVDGCVVSSGICDSRNGAIDINVSGGTPPYAYSWIGPNGYTSSLANPDELAQGIYLLTVTDSQGKQRTASFKVTPTSGNPLQVNLTETCITNNDVTAEITSVTGDTLNFAWSTGASSRGITAALDLPTNFSYSVTVTNDIGCTQVIEEVTQEACNINNPDLEIFQLEVGSVDQGDSDTVCVPFQVSFPQDVQQLQTTVEWDSTQLRFVGWNTSFPAPYLGVPSGLHQAWIIHNDLPAGNYRLGTLCLSLLPGPDSVLMVSKNDLDIRPVNDSLIYQERFILGQIYRRNNSDSSRSGVQLTIPDIHVAAGESTCLPVKVSQQQQLAGMQFALSWDTTRLTFQSVRNWALNTPLEQAFNLDRASEFGELPVLWVDYAGEGIFLEEGTTLFEVCLEPTYREEFSSLELAETVLPSEFVYFDLRTEKAQLEGGSILAVYPLFPGDTNADGWRDYRDLANIGHAFGKTGPSRAERGNNFRSVLGLPWEGAFRQKKLNHRFADSNGDGIVNRDDTLAIYLWYGTEHDFPVPDTTGNAPRKVDGTPLYLEIDTLVPGERVDIPVMLGTENDPVSGIYNARAIIEYDPALVVPGSVSFTFEDSWMGSPAEDLLSIYQENSEAGQVAWAITRTDGQDLAGFGRIGTISITIEDVIFSERSDVDEFKILDAHMETAKEEPMPVAPETTTVVIESTTTSTEDILDDGTTNIYPNPVTEHLYWTTDRADIQRVEVRDIQGRPLQARAYQGNNWITVTGLPAGVYQLHLHTAEGQIVKRFTIAKH
jgi:hypothetical protein